MSAARLSKTLPMSWVVIAIGVFIVGYTFLRLHYAKRGASFEPYHDLGEEYTVHQLLTRGYRGIPVRLERLAEPLPAAAVAPAPAGIIDAVGGLPAGMIGAFAFPPVLPEAIERVTAPREAPAGGTYEFEFTCTQPDYSTQIRRIHLYGREGHLFILPDFEKIPAGLEARSRESTVFASFPLRNLKPGRHTVTLCGARASRSWQFVLK